MSDDMRRRSSDAASRFSGTVALLRYQADNAANESERWLAGYEAETLLWKVLFEAETLVDVLNDDSDADDIQRHARALYESLRVRRLARKLENVAGRTEDEARAFIAKAEELRGRPVPEEQP